jgi:hypothetical protein
VKLSSFEGCEHLEGKGIELNQHYTVTYIFADGSVVLHKEEWINENLLIHEYIISENDSFKLELVSDEEIEESIIYDFENGNKEYIKYDFQESYMNYLDDDKKLKHDFKVGDFAYFTSTSSVSFAEELGFQSYTAYEITSIDKEFNMPVLSYGDEFIMILEPELKYLVKCEANHFGNESVEVDNFLNELINKNFDNNLQKSIDNCLEYGNIKLLKEIHESYLKGGNENELRKIRNGDTEGT